MNAACFVFGAIAMTDVLHKREESKGVHFLVLAQWTQGGCAQNNLGGNAKGIFAFFILPAVSVIAKISNSLLYKPTIA